VVHFNFDSWLLGLSVSLLMGFSAQAGFFEDLKRQTEEVIQNTTKEIENRTNNYFNDSPEKSPPKESTGNIPPQSKETSRPYDPNVVRVVKTRLSEHGYEVGYDRRKGFTGVYDEPTRQAIQKYQRDQGLTVDGKPSSFLSTHLACTGRSISSAAACQLLERQKQQQQQKAEKKKKLAQEKQLFDSYRGPPTYNENIRQLLPVRFSPDRYYERDKDDKINPVLKSALETRYRTEWRNIKNEFQMRRELPKLRKRLLREAESVPFEFRLIVGMGLPKYDFKREGYLLPIPPARTAAFLILNRGVRGSVFMSMPPDRAEEFQNKCSAKSEGCRLYVEKLFRIVQVEPGKYGTTMYGHVKRLRIYGRAKSARGKEMVLSNMLIEVPVAQLQANDSYKGDSDPEAPVAASGDDGRMKLKF